MYKVLPQDISAETKKTLECVRLYLFDLTGEFIDDEQLLRFLAIEFLANVAGSSYFPL